MRIIIHMNRASKRTFRRRLRKRRDAQERQRYLIVLRGAQSPRAPPPLPARGGAGPLGPSARQRTAEDHPCPAGPAQAVGGADAAPVRLDAPYLDTGAVVATTGGGERRGPGPDPPGPPVAGNRCPPGPTTSHRALPLARGAPAGPLPPPYCPNGNRSERVWQELHANVTRNHGHRTITDRLTAVEAYLHQRNAD